MIKKEDIEAIINKYDKYLYREPNCESNRDVKNQSVRSINPFLFLIVERSRVDRLSAKQPKRSALNETKSIPKEAGKLARSRGRRRRGWWRLVVFSFFEMKRPGYRASFA